MAVFAFAGTTTVLAQNSSSENYRMTETQFGNGSSLESCSGQYCARATIGEPTSGISMRSSTASFEDTLGSEPMIEVIIDAGQSNLGVLTTEETATKTTVVRVRHHLSGGYGLQIVGTPPKYGEYTLKTNGVPTASVPGTEQFGINLAANTTPNVGANPLQVPDNQAVFGIVTDNYKTANMFMYASEAVIARSATESGRTDYTISMVINVATTTPAGHFAGDFAMIVIPAY